MSISSILVGGEMIKIEGNTYIVLNKIENNIYNLYKIKTKEIVEKEVKGYMFIKRINEITEYRWMGIEYNAHKIFIDLKTLNISYYNEMYSNDWEYIDDSIVEEVGNNLIITFIDVIINIDLDKLTLRVMDSYSNRFKDYYNFILGEYSDFVFNEKFELGLYTS